MSDTAAPDPADHAFERQVDYLFAYCEAARTQNSNYHNHKERMATVSFIFMTAVAAYILPDNNIPPDWIPALLGPVFWLALLLIWSANHAYLRWQLRNRRVAALYVAIFVRVAHQRLARDITPEDLEIVQTTSLVQTQHRLLRFLEFVFWKSRMVPFSDVSIHPAPRILHEAFETQIKQGTGALWAEVLLTFSSWAVFLIILGRAIVSIR